MTGSATGQPARRRAIRDRTHRGRRYAIGSIEAVVISAMKRIVGKLNSLVALPRGSALLG